MVKHTENGTIRKYTITYGKIIEKQQVFTVVWTIVFVFTMVKLIKIKKTFCQEFHRNHPYLRMSKKYFFWLISYAFPISMIKFKNRLFVKKSKNYLKCEFQKTSNFDLTCWKRMHFFRTHTES